MSTPSKRRGDRPPRRPGLRWLRREPVAPDISDPAPRDDFFAWAATLGPDAAVLEIGTRRSVTGVPTHHQAMFPRVRRTGYVMADVEAGEDVDCVADLHALPADWSGRFDAVVAIAVFEHLERPWIAAAEIRRILKPGGRCYVATHQTFPLHGYPSDFFRFSREALTLLVSDAGLEVLDVAYMHRTWIHLPRPLVPKGRFSWFYNRAWNRLLPSYLVVHLQARRAG